MKPLLLKDSTYLSIESYEKRVRLIVSSDQAELVCRKESFKNLEQFLQSPQQHIFKGRLQLYKNGDEVQVNVKGETLGTVAAVELEKRLSALRK
jgi:hypothetical protein